MLSSLATCCVITILFSKQNANQDGLVSNSAGEAINSFKRWSMAFNERDARGMIAEMHFPHIRLAGTTFLGLIVIFIVRKLICRLR